MKQRVLGSHSLMVLRAHSPTDVRWRASTGRGTSEVPMATLVSGAVPANFKNVRQVCMSVCQATWLQGFVLMSLIHLVESHDAFFTRSVIVL